MFDFVLIYMALGFFVFFCCLDYLENQIGIGNVYLSFFCIFVVHTVSVLHTLNLDTVSVLYSRVCIISLAFLFFFR